MADIERFQPYINTDGGFIEIGVERGELQAPLKIIEPMQLFVPRRIARATRRAHNLATVMNYALAEKASIVERAG